MKSLFDMTINKNLHVEGSQKPSDSQSITIGHEKNQHDAINGKQTELIMKSLNESGTEMESKIINDKDGSININSINKKIKLTNLTNIEEVDSNTYKHESLKEKQIIKSINDSNNMIFELRNKNDKGIQFNLNDTEQTIKSLSNDKLKLLSNISLEKEYNEINHNYNIEVKETHTEISTSQNKQKIVSMTDKNNIILSQKDSSEQEIPLNIELSQNDTSLNINKDSSISNFKIDVNGEIKQNSGSFTNLTKNSIPVPDANHKHDTINSNAAYMSIDDNHIIYFNTPETAPGNPSVVNFIQPATSDFNSVPIFKFGNDIYDSKQKLVQEEFDGTITNAWLADIAEYLFVKKDEIDIIDKGTILSMGKDGRLEIQKNPYSKKLYVVSTQPIQKLQTGRRLQKPIQLCGSIPVKISNEYKNKIKIGDDIVLDKNGFGKPKHKIFDIFKTIIGKVIQIKDGHIIILI